MPTIRGTVSLDSLRLRGLRISVGLPSLEHWVQGMELRISLQYLTTHSHYQQ